MIALLSLVLLESVLQVASLVATTWFRREATPAVHDGRRTVLCVGDSFTYGLGASSHERGAYPAQLQSILDDAQQSTWRVVNGGFPGRNSHQLLERLEGQLTTHHPEFVCILVGLNDRWSHPKRWTGDSTLADDGWRLEWRTLRLWRLLWQPRGVTTAREFEPILRADDPRVLADRSTAVETADLSAADLAALAEMAAESAADRLPLLRRAAKAANSSPTTALRAAVLAALLTGDLERFTAEVTQGTATDPDQLDGVLRELEVTGAAREAICDAFAQPLGWRHDDGIWLHPGRGEHRAHVTVDWQEVGPKALATFENHKEHIKTAVAMCRSHGSLPLLIGYPNLTSFPDAFLLDAAKQAGIEFLPTLPAFAERQKADPNAVLFVADGHCNDAGYRIMAEVVSRRLLGR
jgi:lysophospholipase L1-like esterase